MQTTIEGSPTDTVREHAHRLLSTAQDYDPLMNLIGNARFVLLGEASHGTHEFYHERAQITQRLIEEKEFTAVAVEAAALTGAGTLLVEVGEGARRLSADGAHRCKKRRASSPYRTQ